VYVIYVKTGRVTVSPGLYLMFYNKEFYEICCLYLSVLLCNAIPGCDFACVDAFDRIFGKICSRVVVVYDDNRLAKEYEHPVFEKGRYL